MIKQIFLTFLFAISAMNLFAEAKYIFYFIGDGMGIGHVATAEAYNREYLDSDAPLLMLQFPYGGQVWTYSADDRITDSAAAGTALATGHKTNNGMIGMTADSVAVTSIATILKSEGYAVGIASTVAGDDATPASFYAHSVSRHNKYEIANQAITSNFDFFAAPVWRGSRDKEGNDNEWKNDMINAGYTISYGYDDFLANAIVEKKALLLSNAPQGDQSGFAIDNHFDRLSTQQLTQAALLHLEKRNPEAFFLMVEGGNIDWASHGNDGATVIKEILDFQKAIDVAYQFYLQHPEETLIVITADHDTGGLAFGRKDNERKGDFSLIDMQKMSKDGFSEFCKDILMNKKEYKWGEMKDFLTTNFGFYSKFNLTNNEDRELQESFETTFVRNEGVDEKTLYSNFNQFAVKVFDILNRAMGIGWTSGNHTSNFVPVYAVGCGAEKFGRSLNNTEVPMLILEAADIDKP